MKLSEFRGVKYLAPASVFTIILVVATLSLRLPAASANPPPPDVPDFEGKPVYNTLIDTNEPVRETTVVNGPQAEWVTMFEADFEDDNWEQKWLNASQSGEGYKYGTRATTSTLDPFSTKSAWAVGGSPVGNPDLDPAVDGYPANVNAWLIAGPFDFSNVARVNLAFEYFFEADVGDTVEVQASADFPNFSGTAKDGGDGGWIPADMDLSIYAGEPSVYIAFTFKSDDSPNVSNKLGLLLDNVKLDVQQSTNTHLPYIAYNFMQIPDATPTATITPGDSYYKGFTNNIDPWVAVRWSDGADYELRHSDTCDDNRCGFLNLEVEKSNHYTIVSPKKLSKPYPYTVETKAKIRSPREDMDSYGIVFGASTNGQDCPVGDFTNCFEHYYELRVRYRHTDNSWLEFKLVTVGGHDEDNQAIETDLIEWTSVSQDPDSLAEWDVDVKGNGDMIVKVSDDEVGRTNDSKFINNPFFGLVVRSGSIGSSEVKFDYFEVK
jgi:hypothetical protein